MGAGVERTEPVTEPIVADGLLTIKEAGAFLKVSRATIYTLMDSGDLPFVKIGRARRIPKRAVIEFAQRNLFGSV